MNKIYISAFLLFFCVTSKAQPWQTMSDIPVELAFPVVVELRGNIHVMGGGGPTGATDLHLRYTPSTNSWDTLPPVPYLAQQPAGAVVNDKIHYCGGGYPNTGTRLDDHYYFDPDSNQWYAAADMTVPTAIHEAVGLDGKLYVMSGQPNRTMCEYYDPSTNTWTPLSPLPDMNFWYGAIVATSNSIYRFGGGGYTAPVFLTHRYDQVNDAWIPMGALAQALHGLAGAALNDSLIILSGGYTNGYASDSVMIYNVNAERYTYIDSLPVARDYHSMAVADECAYSVGGHNPQDPAIGVSLLKNCNVEVPTEIEEYANSTGRPYLLFTSDNDFGIRWNHSMRSGSAAFRVLDMSGKVILDKSSDAGDESVIDGSALATGNYIVLITTDTQTYPETWNVRR